MGIYISPSLTVSNHEVTFRYARSPGPGGQHVNKVSTQVTLCFDVAGSKSLSEEQKAVLCKKLRTRINRQGVLRVTSRKHRSQAANKRAATARFAELLARALRPVKRRVKTKVPRAVKENRIQQKKRHGRTKQLRKRPTIDSD